MQNLIFILLFPLIIIGQTNHHQGNYGYGDQRYDMKGNSGLYEIQGSRFYHKKFLPSIINGKKVELAVKRSIHGKEITNKEALANPESLDFFKSFKI